jgi:adenylate kinase
MFMTFIAKRLIIVGPPGSKRKEIALSLGEYLSEVAENPFVCISVGDLLRKEIQKKSEFGKQIVESRKQYAYVKDEIVIDLVKLQIEQLEKDGNGGSWIIEGFPRTRLQAIALQKMGIVPDKFVLLEVGENISIDKVKRNLKSEDEIIQFQEDDIDQFAENALTEYKL